MELGSCRKDSYLQASFNGIAFTAIEVSSEHGRRTAIGEFPFSNEVGAVDMGRKVRRYHFSARLDNDDHQARAVALIAACELPGPGILIHPTRGVVNATVDSLRVTNGVIEAQGITSLDITFVEFNLWQNGLGLVGSLLGLVLRPLLEASSSAFRSTYDVRSEPVYLQQDVLAQASDTALMLEGEYVRQGDPDPSAAADLRQVANDPTQTASAAVMDDTIRLGSAAINQKATTAQRRFDSFRRVANWAASMAVDTTSGQELTAHTRIVAAAYMARAALEREYPEAQQAYAALDTVATVLEQESRIAYDACQNALYLQLSRFRADFTRRMYQIAEGTPRKQQYDFGGAVSPLIAAYAIWDDATRSRELGSGTLVGPNVFAVP